MRSRDDAARRSAQWRVYRFVEPRDDGRGIEPDVGKAIAQARGPFPAAITTRVERDDAVDVRIGQRARLTGRAWCRGRFACFRCHAAQEGNSCAAADEPETPANSHICTRLTT